MAGDPKTDRVQLMISPAQVREIDDWRFDHRIGSRAEAIRILLDIALKAPVMGVAKP